MKKGERVPTMSLENVFLFPIVWVMLLSIFAFKEHSTSIYYQMGLFGLIGMFFSWTDTLIRNTTIEYDTQTVKMRDGISNWTIIPPNSLKEINFAHGRYDLKLSIDNKEIYLKRPFFFYWPKRRKRIIDALLTFNPEAKKVGF